MQSLPSDVSTFTSLRTLRASFPLCLISCSLTPSNEIRYLNFHDLRFGARWAKQTPLFARLNELGGSRVTMSIIETTKSTDPNLRVLLTRPRWWSLVGSSLIIIVSFLIIPWHLCFDNREIKSYKKKINKYYPYLRCHADLFVFLPTDILFLLRIFLLDWRLTTRVSSMEIRCIRVFPIFLLFSKLRRNVIGCARIYATSI